MTNWYNMSPRDDPNPVEWDRKSGIVRVWSSTKKRYLYGWTSIGSAVHWIGKNMLGRDDDEDSDKSREKVKEWR